MASFNKVILLGNLTRDPQVRYTPSGMAVADIGLAMSRTWTDKQTNQRKEDVTFVDVTLWGRTAEIAGEYLAKGRQVLIEGRLHLDQWDDRETGQKRSKLKVVCEDMRLVGNRADGQSQDVRGIGGPPSQTSEPSEGFYNQAPAEPAGGFDAPPTGPGEGDVPF